MNESPIGRITPWVGRILALNAIVMLLQETLFTSDAITDALLFEPALALQRPWTFLSYMILHGSLFHLIGNSIALYAFGPAVEARLAQPVAGLRHDRSVARADLAHTAGSPVGRIAAAFCRRACDGSGAVDPGRRRQRDGCR